MRILKVLSLLAALALLSGAVLDAQTGLVRQVLTGALDAGNKGGAKKASADDSYLHGTKAGPLIREEREEPAPQAQQAAPQPKKDGGK